MKLIDHLRRSLDCCFCSTKNATTSNPKATTIPASTTIKNHLIADLFACQEPSPSSQDQQEDSLIDAAAAPIPNRPSSPSTHSTVVGTIFGRRRSHVSFCVQSSPSTPPPFLFELSIPTHLLAKEMDSGLLRIALECHRGPVPHPSLNSLRRHSSVWTTYCNGRKVGYAVRRRPTDTDIATLRAMRSMTAGAGVLFSEEGEKREEGEMLYMRATYERVVGSRDSVSYHLINPGGGGDQCGGGGSPSHELSVFLLRT